MNAPLKVDAPRTYTPEERLAMLRALPVAAEPRTAEEDAIFEQIQAEVRAGKGGGVKTEEILATLEKMRRDAGE